MNILRHMGVLLREHKVYWLAIVASLSLSGWISWHESVINSDAICYILSAAKVESGLQAAMQLCGQAIWPFYSMVIFAFAKMTNLAYIPTAYFLDAIFTALTVTTFILITKELGGDKRTLWLAAFVILFAHQFNDVRQYIVRDHGYWAFYLLSLFCLLRYMRTPNWRIALVWSVSLLLATLFRIEGALFLLFLPFVLFFDRGFSLSQRVRAYLWLNLPLFLLALVLLVAIFIHSEESLRRFGRVVEVPQQLQHGIAEILYRFQTTKVALIDHVLTAEAARDAGMVLVVTLMVSYLLNIIANLSWIYTGLVVYSWRQKALKLSSPASLILAAYLFVNLLVTFGFFAEHLFLTKRYLMAFSLVLMLWVPFALNQLFHKKLLTGLLVIAIIISTLGGIVGSGHDKTYIRTAGQWLAQHLPANASLYSNDHQLMYYSAHFGDGIFQKYKDYAGTTPIEDGRWQQFDYLALRFNKHEKNTKLNALLQTITTKPILTFANKQGDKIIIVQNAKVKNKEKGNL